MLILNYAHPLTEAMLAQTAALLGVEAATLEVRNIATQIDRSQPIAAEAARLVAAAGLGSEQWQTLPFLLNPPGLALVALALASAIHGRCGYWPTVLAVAPVAGSTPPVFAVNEVVNLQSLREAARLER
jgi:hypothetical protein